MKTITSIMNEDSKELPMGDCWVEVSKGAFMKIMNDTKISNGDLFCGVHAYSEITNYPICKDFVDKDVVKSLKASLDETNNATVWLKLHKTGESFKYKVQITKIVL